MKQLSRYLLVGLCVLIPWQLVQTNPIALKFMSELQLDAQNPAEWTIEINVVWSPANNMDGWFITTASDTALLDSGILLSEGAYIVIRRDSLESPLYLRTSGEIITLYDNSGQWMDELRYGNVEYAEAPSPRQGQSICLDYDWYHYWYVDSSPTFGYENDTEGAMSTIEGHVYNAGGFPLSGVTVRHDYTSYQQDSIYVLTDIAGYYSIDKRARSHHFDAHLVGYASVDTTFQAWPDTTHQVDFYLSPEMSIDEEELQIPEQLELKQNYPNPFNASTSIQFGLPSDGQVSIHVLKLDGSHVANVMSEYMSAGRHTVSWDSSNIPSGIYFYKLQLGEIFISRKMILLK
ncbi:MAG: T9SS type A sorting domain-containing protein [Candidatus Marinimicrobia bacterium]|nr:T9SS type A sorting domain-containing protein [Candidatus Neomarinimicrobiota bacterium]MBT3631257.1 T9SS type A sorting domain-containing protein [Candidatus Neomarinimicrobiota bacterium]MBT3824765.1 T9SS type A sorting domain-containing protein [Candidatus Neomarinimicrobiota bacterium]MBT4132043.1 T9SS type A sorting domain-containing protein [Candidatus Neomarinimicrobiota bacterium]MBT4296158.1 T9SS type A sorting domain-containing protein [Candidatus Neomarinimicrobiota bacterium]